MSNRYISRALAKRINANRNRYAAAPVRDALEAQAIRALRETEATKQAAASGQPTATKEGTSGGV